MRKSYHHRLAIMVAAVLALPIVVGPVRAEDSATVPTDPGFRPGTGQINPGVEVQAPSQSSEVTNIPTPEESVDWRNAEHAAAGDDDVGRLKRASRVAKRRRRPAGNHHRRLGARFEFGRVRSTVHFCKDNRVGHIRRATAIRADRFGR